MGVRHQFADLKRHLAKLSGVRLFALLNDCFTTGGTSSAMACAYVLEEMQERCCGPGYNSHERRPSMASTRTFTKPHPRYATLPEAAEYCRSSRRSLERRIAEGKLTRFKNGFRVIVDLNEIDSLLRGERR